MDVKLLKENIRKQIDALQNEAALQVLHDAAVDYNTFNGKDVLDALSDEQKKRLAQSMAQANEGNTIPHAEAMQLLSKWRNK